MSYVFLNVWHLENYFSHRAAGVQLEDSLTNTIELRNKVFTGKVQFSLQLINRNMTNLEELAKAKLKADFCNYRLHKFSMF